MLVAAGVNDPFAPGLPSAELYDPATETSTATGSLNTGRYWHTATLLLNGKVLVAGGRGNIASAELYDSGYRSVTLHHVGSPDAYENLTGDVDTALTPVAVEATLKAQPAVSKGLVADEVTPLQCRPQQGPSGALKTYKVMRTSSARTAGRSGILMGIPA